METKQIYKAIPAIIGDVKGIAKTHKNLFHNYMFRGIDDVYNAINELLAKHKVSIFPSYEVISETIGTTKKGEPQKTVVLKGIYKLVAEDGSFETVSTIGEAADTSDKAYNKAMSTAYKYALFQTFCIPTEEQKDTEHSSPEVTVELKPELSAELLKQVNTCLTKAKWNAQSTAIKNKYGVSSFKELSQEQAKEIIKKCDEHIKKQEVTTDESNS